TGSPQTFGSWQVASGQNGRPVATSAAVGVESSLRELRIECVPGGRLEYVPVPAKSGTINSMWIDGADDTQSELQLANGRATGRTAALLSKEFMTMEGNARKDGAQNWGMRFVVNDPNGMESSIGGNGFSQMRAHMLANCKN